MESKSFVTLEELEKRLVLCEKLGASEVASNKAEESAKKFVRSHLEVTNAALLKSFEERAEKIFEKVDAQAKRHIETSSQQLQTVLAESMAGQIQKAHREILAETAEVIKAKTNEIRKTLAESQKGFEATLEKLFSSKLSNFEESIRLEMAQFEKSLSDKTLHTAQGAVDQVRDEVKKDSSLALSEGLKEVSRIVEALRTELSVEMSKKLVDKQAIEQKMRDIEFELHKKAQSVIDFNIAQARQNMEQAARAELEEGIKTAAGKIMSGLT